MGNYRNGFTAVELIIVTFIIAVLMVIAVVRFQLAIGNQGAYNAGRIIALQLQREKQRAETLELQAGIRIVDENTYEVREGPPGGPLAVVSGARRVDEMYGRVRFVDPAGTEVTFDPGGVRTGPGMLSLKSVSSEGSAKVYINQTPIGAPSDVISVVFN